MSVDITSRLHKFHAAVCAVLKDRLPNFEHIYVRLLLSKCLPILYYGLDSLSIDCKVLQAVTKCWNMAFRWIFGLRKYDSTRLLLKSCNTMSAKFLLHRCWFLFCNSVSLSQVPVVHNLWCWCRSLSSYNRLLSLHNLVDVGCKAEIYTAVVLVLTITVLSVIIMTMHNLHHFSYSSYLVCFACMAAIDGVSSFIIVNMFA